jgi:hypothetical protein
MNETDLKRIEEALGRPLPAVFRDVMSNFPQKLIAAATLTDSDGNEFLDDMMITPNADFIIAGIEYRKQDPDWPKTYMVVGDNGCGEEFSINISEESCPVFMSGPHNDAGASGPSEEGYFEQLSSELGSWVSGLVAQIR